MINQFDMVWLYSRHSNIFWTDVEIMFYEFPDFEGLVNTGLAWKFYLNPDVESLNNSQLLIKDHQTLAGRDSIIWLPPNACFLCFILRSLMSKSYNFTMRFLQKKKKPKSEYISRSWKLNFSSLGFPQKYV